MRLPKSGDSGIPESGRRADLLDLERLKPDELELWDEMWAARSAPLGPAVDIWSFGYICVLELGRIPSVVAERLQELDPENLILQYQQNMRRAREKRRRDGQKPGGEAK